MAKVEQVPFIGPSYSLRSVSVDCQRTVNIYPCVSESGTAKAQDNKMYFQSTPGLKEYISINNIENENSPIRAIMTNTKGDLVIVIEDNVITYNEYSDEQRIIGKLNTSEGHVEIADNGFQLGIVDGDYYYVYIYEDDTFTDYSDLPGWQGSDHIIYFSTYFIFIKRNSQQFFISRPYDGTILNPLDFASAESNPDNILNAIVIGQQLMFFGVDSIELFVNTGDSTFPIEKQNGGGVMEYGCIAPNTICLIDNQPIWIGKDKNGYGSVYLGLGNVQKVSNFAIDYAIQQMENIESSVAYTYQQDGHYFYVVNFPNANTTWVWDKTLNMWHERQYLNPINGMMERQRGQLHTLFKQKHLVTDYKNSKIYELSLDEYTDNGDPIKRIRTSPHFYSPSLEDMIYRTFQLDLDVGSYYDIDYSNLPKINLRFSDNGGKTWSNYKTIELWEVGNYKKRCIWRRLGMARDRVFEVSISDPIKVTWLAAYIDAGV